MKEKSSWICDANCLALKGSIFEGLNKPCLDYLSKGLTTNIYKPKQNLFYENNKPYGVYYIYSGKVKLYKTGRADREQITGIAKTGDVLGVPALMSGRESFTSAETLETTRICFIERTIFFAALKMDFRLADNVMSRLGGELGDILGRLESVVQKPVKNRVAELLCKLTKEHPPMKDGFINIKLSRADLAKMADTAQETLIRSLKSLEERKLISLKNKKIIILQPELLQKESQ